MYLADLQATLAQQADPEDARNLLRYFKTGPGDYGEGDRFRGIRMPVLRSLVRQYRTVPVEDAFDLLTSAFHEDRMLALLLLVSHFKRGKAPARKLIYDGYLSHTSPINNWDLVDSSASQIVGAYLRDKDRAPLYRLVASPVLWERRIAVIATLDYIKQGAFDELFRLAVFLLDDPEDLIHKAVGWMLREAGKRDLAAEEAFLHAHYPRMPRTMLRYAIEKFPEPRRQAYLKGTV